MQTLREELIALMSRVMQSSDVPLLAGQALDEYADKIGKLASVITYCNGGRLRAFIAFYCNEPNNEVGFVTMLMVDPAFRRKGLASVLTGAALAAIRASGFGCCRLKVDVRNLAAVAFYEQLGFTRTMTEGSEHTYELRFRGEH